MDPTTIRRILTSVFILAVLSATVTSATFAAFKEGDAVLNTDVFQAGTITLTLAQTEQFTTDLTHDNLAPGDQTSATLQIVNDGTIYDNDADGHQVVLDLTVSGDNSALTQHLKVITFTYGTTDLTSLATENATDTNAYLDVADLVEGGAFSDLPGPGLSPGKDLVVVFELDHETTQDELDGVTGAADLTFGFDLRNVPLNTN